MRKDLAICLDEARRNGVSLPMTALVDQFYAEVENMGGKRWDTSSLFARLEHLRQAKRLMTYDLVSLADIAPRPSASRRTSSTRPLCPWCRAASA